MFCFKSIFSFYRVLRSNEILPIRFKSINMSYEYFESPEAQNGSPLIIMHGLLGSKRLWKNLGFSIGKKMLMNVYTVDVRNHGESPRTVEHSYPLITEDVETFIKKHSISKAFLLGHSMGGRAMMYFALKNPQLVEKLIVGDISPISISSQINSVPEILRSLKNIPMPKNVSKLTAIQQLDKQLSTLIPDKREREFILSNVKEIDNSFEWLINIDTILNQFENIFKFPNVTNMKFNGEVLFLAGEKSDFIKNEDRQKILEIFPKAKFSIISNSGHWIQIDNPTEFLEKTISFLKSDLESNFINMSYTYFKSSLPKEGPPLIIMHGTLEGKRKWKSLGFQLCNAGSLNVFVVDARNHGRSPNTDEHSYPLMAEDIKIFMAKQGLSKAFLFGHSMGGRSMMYFALKYPQYVEKLIVCEASPVSTGAIERVLPTYMKYLKLIKLPKDVSQLEALEDVNKQLSKYIQPSHIRNFFLSNLIKIDKRFEWRLNLDTLIKEYTNILQFPDTHLEFRGETLFLIGETSDFVRDEDHGRILKIFPNAKFCKIREAGHWVHIDNQSEFIETVTSFVTVQLKSIDMSYVYFENASPHTKFPLIIMHSFLAGKRNWKSLGFKIAKQGLLNIYVPDTRNHGRSPHTLNHSYELISEDIKAFMVKHGITKALLLGLCTGGCSVMYFALKHPQFVEKLVICDVSPISLSSDLNYYRDLLKAVKNVQMPSNVSQLEALKEVNKQLVGSIPDERKRTFILTNLTQGVDNRFKWKFNIHTLLNDFDNILKFPDVSNLKFTGQVLFLSGEKSNFIKDDDHKKILQLFPNAKFSKISNAGHWIHFDNETEFIEKIVSFLTP